MSHQLMELSYDMSFDTHSTHLSITLHRLFGNFYTHPVHLIQQLFFFSFLLITKTVITHLKSFML